MRVTLHIDGRQKCEIEVENHASVTVDGVTVSVAPPSLDMPRNKSKTIAPRLDAEHQDANE